MGSGYHARPFFIGDYFSPTKPKREHPYQLQCQFAPKAHSPKPETHQKNAGSPVAALIMVHNGKDKQ